MAFADDLRAQREAAKPTADVPFRLNGNPYVLRFTRMDPWEWAEEADRHPVRPGVGIDSAFGYNMRSLVRAVAPKIGTLLQGDEAEDVDDWDELFHAMSPSAVQRMCSEVFGLHEAETLDGMVKNAKKLLTAARKSSTQR